MKRSTWVSAILGFVLVSASLSAQGPYSAQIQQLLNGNNYWRGTNTFNNVVATGNLKVPGLVAMGPLATSWTVDPIYGNAVNSMVLGGFTATATDHNNFINYLAVSVEPDAPAAGIYAGRETLMYLPDTNANKVNQVYGGEDFIQSFSALGASALFGRYVSIENYAGPITGRATALSLNVENDAEGVTINGTRGMYVRGAQNYGATSTLTTHEAIKIDAGSNSGTVGDNYGLRIIDQTLGGTVSGVNRAIDVNGKFIVGPDGATLSVNGTIQGAYKSSDGTTGVTVAACTGFKNGLCISGT